MRSMLISDMKITFRLINPFIWNLRKIRACVVVTNDIYNERVPVIQVVPITSWSTKKPRIKTNIEILPSKTNGLTKKSIADCLQTRPIDRRFRLVEVRGELSSQNMRNIDQALKIVFNLD